jgi:hypothetical protein
MIGATNILSGAKTQGREQSYILQANKNYHFLYYDGVNMELIGWTLIVYLLTPTMMETVSKDNFATVEACMAAGDKIIRSNKEKANSYMTTCSAVYKQEKSLDEIENGK